MTLSPEESAHSWPMHRGCSSISAPSIASAARPSRSRRKRPRRTKCPGCSIPSSSTAAPPRAAFARALVAHAPKVLRLNDAEFAALAGTAPPSMMRPRPMRARTGLVVALSGPTDLVTDGTRTRHRQRPPADGQGDRLGCAASALIAACLGVEADAWRAAAAALTLDRRCRRARRRRGGRSGILRGCPLSMRFIASTGQPSSLFPLTRAKVT